MTTYERIGENIRREIKKKRITQYELAEICGVTPALMSYVLNGLRSPSLDMMMRISKQLGCTIDDLLREEGDK